MVSPAFSVAIYLNSIGLYGLFFKNSITETKGANHIIPLNVYNSGAFCVLKSRAAITTIQVRTLSITAEDLHAPQQSLLPRFPLSPLPGTPQLRSVSMDWLIPDISCKQDPRMRGLR